MFSIEGGRVVSDREPLAESDKLRQLGLAVIETEAKAVAALAERIDANFVKACHYMLACKGRIVVLGMGKSGH
ncbi:MAG: KpsF/GutQ family protein, partial [Halothiobacillaceae bacterium]